MTYFSDVVKARELLLNLTQREIRGKYKRTALGQLWSLANPIAAIIIYTFVFSFIFQIEAPIGAESGIQNYALFLVCALLPWMFFSRNLSQGVEVLVGNAGLIQKVYFPRIVLPFSLTVALVFSWMIEMLVLVGALLVLQAFGVVLMIPGIILAMCVLALFATGLAMVGSIINVYFRDFSYLVSILVQFWFYLTPILYPISLVKSQSDAWGDLGGTGVTLLDLYNLNPMVPFVSIFRSLLYDNQVPDVTAIGMACGWAALAFLAGYFLYSRKEKQLAELL